MYTYNYVRYIHHKPPYKPLKYYNFYNLQNDDLTCCHEAKIPSQKENNEKENPQITPAIQYPVTVPKTYNVLYGSSRKKDMTVITSTDSDPPDPVDGQRLIEEDIFDKFQNTVEFNKNNASTVSINNDKHSGNDSQSFDLPPISEEIPLSEPSECDVHSISQAMEQPANIVIDAGKRFTDVDTRFTNATDVDSCDESDEIPLSELSECDVHSISQAMEQPLNMIMDATSRLMDAVTRFVDAADAKSCDRAEHCGLLHFREWWELDEVNILVGGKQIDGIPIFVEEDTLRVINNNYSYFIPLGKVDYIRTTDGLHSGFDLSDDKPIRK